MPTRPTPGSDDIPPIECDICEDSGFISIDAPVYGEAEAPRADVEIKKCICQI